MTLGVADMSSTVGDADHQPPEIMRGHETDSAFGPDLSIAHSAPLAGYRLVVKQLAEAKSIVRDDRWPPGCSSLGGNEEGSENFTVHLIGADTFFDPAEDSCELSGSGQAGKIARTLATFQSYQMRIDALRDSAEQDGYGLNAASERDFRDFVSPESGFFIRKGHLVLMDNGNLRLVWKDGSGTHLGLQFLGGRMLQYVIFKRRMAKGQISRVAGRDSFEGVRRQIGTFDLQSLIDA